jgi:hypothetical protein
MYPVKSTLNASHIRTVQKFDLSKISSKSSLPNFYLRVVTGTKIAPLLYRKMWKRVKNVSETVKSNETREDTFFPAHFSSTFDNFRMLRQPIEDDFLSNKNHRSGFQIIFWVLKLEREASDDQRCFPSHNSGFVVVTKYPRLDFKL